MVSRPAGFRRVRTLEAEAGKVKLVDEYIDTRTGLSSAT
jgi:hypothetical protein